MFGARWRTTDVQHQHVSTCATVVAYPSASGSSARCVRRVHESKIQSHSLKESIQVPQEQINTSSVPVSNNALLEVKLGLANGTAHVVCQKPASMPITPYFLEANLDTLLMLKGSHDVRNLINRYPDLLAAPLDSWFIFFTSYGMSKPDFWGVLNGAPALFEQGNIYNTGMAISLLKSIGFSDDDIIKTVAIKWPQLLLAHTTNTQPVLQYLRHVGLSNRIIRQMISRTPSFFCTVGESSLHAKVNCLLKLGFSNETVRRFISSNMGVLVADLADTEAKLSFFHCIGLSNDQLVDILSRCPGLLTMSGPNLMRKWRFLSNEMGGDVDDVLKYPQYFMHGLQKVIGPRFYYVQHRPERTARCVLEGSGKLSLRKLLSSTVEEFVHDVGGDYDDYIAFAAGCDFDMAINWSSNRVVS